MCSRNELEIILKQMVEVYRSVYGSEIVKVVLYGSYARGDNQADNCKSNHSRKPRLSFWFIR